MNLFCSCVSDDSSEEISSSQNLSRFKSRNDSKLEAAETEAETEEPSALDLFHRGCLLEENKIIKQAVLCYQQAILLEPAMVSAHYNLAHVLQLLNDFESAERHYRITLQLDPEHYKATYNLGYLYLNIFKTPEEALRLFGKCLEMNPSDFDARISFALAKIGIGAVVEAIACYESILREKPDEIIARFNLGNAYLDILNYPAALSQYMVNNSTIFHLKY